MSTREQNERIELLQGTLDLLILRTLQRGPHARPCHRKGDRIPIGRGAPGRTGSLYPALHRLIKRRWISAEDGTSENNRRAKFYALTSKGRRQLTVETGKWDKLARAIAQILRPGEQEEA